jgi:hypothetical protein
MQIVSIWLESREEGAYTLSQPTDAISAKKTHRKSVLAYLIPSFSGSGRNTESLAEASAKPLRASATKENHSWRLPSFAARTRVSKELRPSILARTQASNLSDSQETNNASTGCGFKASKA